MTHIHEFKKKTFLTKNKKQKKRQKKDERLKQMKHQFKNEDLFPSLQPLFKPVKASILVETPHEGQIPCLANAKESYI